MSTTPTTVLLVDDHELIRSGLAGVFDLDIAARKGAPVYADQTHGWDVLTGPTGGYIIGFVLAAALTGFLARERWDRRFSSAVAAMLSGNVVIYLVGLPWLAAKIDTGLEDTLEAGLYPFVVGDLVKLYLAGALLPAAWALVRRFKG